MSTLPVPGGPANRTALPAIFLLLINSTMTPHAYTPQWKEIISQYKVLCVQYLVHTIHVLIQLTLNARHWQGRFCSRCQTAQEDRKACAYSANPYHERKRVKRE
jgi:hypothetical protein